MCIRRLRNVPALLHIGINQRADYWHQFHQQLLQMHRVSFSFDNDNNENIIFILFVFVLLIIFIFVNDKLLN